jgi:formate hydrogenlyase subunit 3/multisubunit Na+/H+ antiporter MnhD subunit
MADKPALGSMTIWGLLVTAIGLIASKVDIGIEANEVAAYMSWFFTVLGTVLTYTGRKRLKDKLVHYKSLTLLGLLTMLVVFVAGKFDVVITDAEGAQYATYIIGAIGFVVGAVGRLRRGGISGLLSAGGQS